MTPQKASVQVAIITELDSVDLQETVNSVIGQLESDMHKVDEIVIVVNRDQLELNPADQVEIDTLVSQRAPITIDYEARRGIPYGRNRALSLWVESKSEWLAFIDDDCVLEDGWLRNQLKTANEFAADAVSSPWILKPIGTPSPLLPEDTWKKRTYRSGLKEVSHGQYLQHAYTRGVVFSGCKDLVAKNFLKFDESRAALGGSDVLFFEDFRRAGGKIVLADGPLIVERYRGSRLTLKWHFNRKVRNIQFIVERSRNGEMIQLWATPLNLLSWLLLTLAGARAVLVRREGPRRLRFFRPSPAFVGHLAFRFAQFWGILTLLFGFRHHSYSVSGS